ncbi:bile acid:sodium symporter [Escherichia coli]
MFTVQGSLEQVGKIMLQLLLPFVLGHLSRPWIGDWVSRNKKWIAKTDQTSILLVVYTAFSEAVVNGIWHKVGWGSLLFIVVVSCVLLAIVIVVNVFMARRLGFNKADEITIVFCGSKKSLANGIPMANILSPTSVIGMMVLPLMIFHQIQLMVVRCWRVDTNARPNSYRRSRKAAPIKLQRTLQGLDQLRQPLGFNQQRDLH